MNNRKLISPILCAAAVSILVSPLYSQAQTAPSTPVVLTPAPVSAAKPATPPAPVPHTISYTVAAHDTLTGLARKFNTTRKHLQALNNLSSTKLTPGQVLLIPSTKKAASATAKASHTYAVAQPVQDFDVPASTFGSCPVPVTSPDEDTAAAPDTEKPAPIAKLVSPAEIAEEERAQTRAAAAAATRELQSETAATAPPVVKPAPSGLASSSTQGRRAGTSTPNMFPAPLPYNSTVPRLSSRNPSAANGNGATGFNQYAAAGADAWANRFLTQARLLGDQGIEYDDDWRPPGERSAWTMDCSNTARYLYKVTAGILLPRTASDQYYYLHLQGKAWDVPQAADGWADCAYLRSHLRPGDLLFWENTYRPERQPPITHVMVFLGTNARGQWIMAGSQGSRGGEHNRRNGGPDIYIFKPTQACGGYTTWMGLVHHQGRFCAYGRPLDADRSKLSVATDD